MKRKRSGIILMILGVIVALLAGLSVFIFAPKGTPASQVVEIKKGKVLTVTQLIGEREVVQPAFVREIELPVEAIPPNALTKREDVANKMTITKLYPSLPIIKEQISTKSVSDGYAFKLDNGKVLVAVNFASAINIMTSGAVRPGDRVDLIAVTPGKDGTQIAPTMQNITVTAVSVLPAPSTATNPTAAASTSAQAPKGTTSTTTLLFFEVSEQDALILKFLETLGVDVVLRAAGDNEIQTAQIVDMDYMVSKYKLQKPVAK